MVEEFQAVIATINWRYCAPTGGISKRISLGEAARKKPRAKWTSDNLRRLLERSGVSKRLISIGTFLSTSGSPPKSLRKK